MTSYFSKLTIQFIVLVLVVGVSLGQPPALGAQENTCRVDPDDERPLGPKPKMDRYVVQEIYLGMSFKELKLIKPQVLVRPVKEGVITREYVAELSTKNEQFTFIFTWQGRLYKLIYQKDFDAAVQEVDLRTKLLQFYGTPNVWIDQPVSKKVFEACWGECKFVREKQFCFNQDTENWYTYFSASLGIARKKFSIILHDSILYEKNEIGFLERINEKILSPSTNELQNLKF